MIFPLIRTRNVFISRKILSLNAKNFNKLTTRNFRIITQNLFVHRDSEVKQNKMTNMEKIRDNFSLADYDCIGFDLGKFLI